METGLTLEKMRAALWSLRNSGDINVTFTAKRNAVIVEILFDPDPRAVVCIECKNPEMLDQLHDIGQRVLRACA